jgi:hypothetical protein
MTVFRRERFSSEVTLTPALVGAFAQAAGDDNPVHHDPEFAASTRYGRPIASDKLNGNIVDLRGRIRGQDGQTALEAKGRVLIYDE